MHPASARAGRLRPLATASGSEHAGSFLAKSFSLLPQPFTLCVIKDLFEWNDEIVSGVAMGATGMKLCDRECNWQCTV